MAKLLVVATKTPRSADAQADSECRCFYSFIGLAGAEANGLAFSRRYLPRRLPHNQPSHPSRTQDCLTLLLMSSRDVTSRLRESVWQGSVPLELRLHNGDCRTYDESDPYMVGVSSLE